MRGDGGGFAVYSRNVWKWRCQGVDKGLLAMTRALILVLNTLSPNT